MAGSFGATLELGELEKPSHRGSQSVTPDLSPGCAWLPHWAARGDLLKVLRLRNTRKAPTNGLVGAEVWRRGDGERPRTLLQFSSVGLVSESGGRRESCKTVGTFLVVFGGQHCRLRETAKRLDDR